MFQIVDFSSVNDLKFTYVHLQFQKFFPGVIPRTPMVKGREGQGKGGEGKGGEAKEGRGGGKGKEGREGREGGRGWGEPPPKTNPGYGLDVEASVNRQMTKLSNDHKTKSSR
jgi:hypothetical protein